MTLMRPDWSHDLRDAGRPPSPVRIWRLRLDDLQGDCLDVLRPLTVPAEHDRARRFRFDADRHRHLAGRGLIRLLLAHQYGCAPREVSLAEGPDGKPRPNEAPDDAPTLTFNLAHTENVVAVALSRTRPVGIDVEPLTRVDHHEALAERVLTEAELRQWKSLPPPDRPAFFIHVWTCKEAFLKATGRGLRRAPDTIECTFEGDTVAALDDAEAHCPHPPRTSAAHWSPFPFQAAEGVAGAVVRHQRLPSPPSFADASTLLNHHRFA